MVWVFPSAKLITTESARLIALYERTRIADRTILRILIWRVIPCFQDLQVFVQLRNRASNKFGCILDSSSAIMKTNIIHEAMRFHKQNMGL